MIRDLIAYLSKQTDEVVIPSLRGELTTQTNNIVTSYAAPVGATYIVQTPNASLTAEQALASLATGYMKVTTTTGVVSSQAVPIPAADGGTGINNSTRTLTISTNGGTLDFSSAASTLTIPASGTAALGTGAANQLAYWSGTNALTSSANYTYDGTSAIITSDTNGLTLVAATATGTSDLLIKTIGTVGGSGGAARVRFYDNTAVAGDLIGALNNAAGNRYFGFVARQDRDGNNLPLRFFTNTATPTATTALFIDSADGTQQGWVAVGNSTTPVSRLHVEDSIGAILTLSRNDTSISLNDVIGKLQFHGNDTQLVTQNLFGYIEMQAVQAVTTDAAAGKLIVAVTGTTATGAPIEQFNLINGTLTLKDALDIAVNATTGTKIGTAITQKLGFYNATPIAQRAGAAQAAVATTAATQTTPWGFSTQAQADAIVALVNELRAWAVAQGFIKGAA